MAGSAMGYEAVYVSRFPGQQEHVRVAMGWAVAKAKELGLRITDITPIAPQRDLFERDGSLANLPPGVREQTWRALGGVSEVAVAFWPDAETIEKIERSPRLRGLCVVPHGEDVLRPWLRARQATDLLGERPVEAEPTIVDPVVLTAMRTVVNSVNPSSGFTDPRDRSGAISALQILHGAGHQLDPQELWNGRWRTGCGPSTPASSASTRRACEPGAATDWARHGGEQTSSTIGGRTPPARSAGALSGGHAARAQARMGDVPESYGVSIERRRREIAAHHGVADFVFRPVDVRKGKGQREVGDHLLWVGDMVAIVSSKSRAPDAAAKETQNRRRLWLDANVEEAYDQIRGVHRNLTTAAPGQIVLESERDVRVPWDPATVSSYVGLVVVEAPPTDEDYAPPLMLDGVPTVAMLGADHDEVHALLPSTTAMLRYLNKRAAYVPRCPMGSELDVFALIIQHEHNGTEIELPEAGLPRGYLAQLRATHPDWFFGGEPDDRFALVVDAMIEGLSDPDPALSMTSRPTDYMHIAAFLDRISLFDRVVVGKAVIAKCKHVGTAGGYATALAGFGHGQLCVVSSDSDRRQRADWMRTWAFARHVQALGAGAPASLTTLGVATDPMPTEHRSHDFALYEGTIDVPADQRRQLDAEFGVPDLTRALNRIEGSRQ